MYILVAIDGSLSTIRDLVQKGETSYVSLLIRVFFIMAIIYLIKTRQRWVYLYSIFLYGFIILSSIFWAIYLPFYSLKDYSLIAVLSDHNIFIFILFELLSALFATPLFILFIYAYKRSKVFYLSLDELIKNFIDNAKKHGEFLERENKVNTKIGDNIWLIHSALKKLDPELNSLVPLLDYDNNSVRKLSALYLLSIREKEALETLDQLSKKEGTVADNAKNIAKSWRDGDQGLLKVLGK
jgi:hypothetical protein